jgi:hypothetical protein
MAGIVAVASGALGCGDASRTGRSPMYLVVQEMEASAGADTTLDGKLRSDVVTKGTIYDDLGHASFSLSQKDIGTPGAPSAPSSNNAVTLTRYRVEYVRADGRNTPGVDVPYPFDGAATVTVPPDGTAELNFTLVRIQAKLEAPLAALQGMGGAIAISTIANVTFYGRDQVGNEISATGSIGVTFADWADPD